MASGSWDGEVKLWNLADGKLLKTIIAAPGLQASRRPDGGEVTSGTTLERSGPMRRNCPISACHQLILVAVLSMCAAPGTSAEPSRPLGFVNDVVPILTKAACNSGGCHAKAGNGQNGFRLSLLGFRTPGGLRAYCERGRGRRVFPAAPGAELAALEGSEHRPARRRKEARSELGGLQKALAEWIRDGMAYGKATDPTLASIEVQPRRNVIKIHEVQQLKVLARYSDGHTRDVTRLALYEPNDKGMAEADENGRVKILDVPGNVAVMVRIKEWYLFISLRFRWARRSRVSGREELHRRYSSFPT